MNIALAPRSHCEEIITNKVALIWHIFISFDDLLNNACKGNKSVLWSGYQLTIELEGEYNIFPYINVLPQWTNEYWRLIVPSCIWHLMNFIQQLWDNVELILNDQSPIVHIV